MKILILHKGSFTNYEFEHIYLDRAKTQGIEHTAEFEAMPVYFPYSVKKVPVADQKEWLQSVSDTLNQFNYILCTEPEYFKTLTKQSKPDGSIGMVYESQLVKPNILYLPSIHRYNHDKERQGTAIDRTFKALHSHITGSYQDIGIGIIHSESYPKTISEISNTLAYLKPKTRLYCDIEAFSLKVTEAGIGTIGFSWDKHNGVAFPVDLGIEPSKIRELLKNFFIEYQGELVFHKSNYDVPVLVYNLFQNQDITNVKGQLEGLNAFFGENLDKLHDSLLVTYLATNSCSGNILGLKELAQPFAGNWAVDVKDITKVPLDGLLKYNLIDCLSTCYVMEEYYPKMVQDNQEKLYKEHFLPYLKDNMRCQLNGLPIDLEEVAKLKANLLKEQEELYAKLSGSNEVKETEWKLAEELTFKRNAKLKTKQDTVEQNLKPMNFTSKSQINMLIYNVMGLEVIELTDTGLPKADKSTLKKLLNYTENQSYKNILTWLIELADVEKILNAFIPSFEKAFIDKNGQARVMSYFNLGGTVSGRLSSSGGDDGLLNQQQIPATGSRFAKPVKKCFKSTDEWIFCGIDFSSLEDYISALTTKDPNKLKVYLEGYDGHCLRAYSYFGSQMPDIKNTVESINSIQKNYKSLRQASKQITFACTYSGTPHTLMKNCGLSKKEAERVYKAYHEMYSVSGKWVQKHIEYAKKYGYVEVAFGLRVRTPLLQQNAEKEVSGIFAAEARTAGNALGQGWGMLNDRAMNEVLNQIDKLGLSEYILPVSKCHDCCYYLVRNDISTIELLNKLCIKAASWQEHPDIWHEKVHLHGQLDLFYPDWSHPITLPEECNTECLEQTVQKALNQSG